MALRKESLCTNQNVSSLVIMSFILMTLLCDQSSGIVMRK